MTMTLQPSDASGHAPEHVNSYWDGPHIDRQFSVPPDTPPSATFTVAPLLTWQICPGGPAKQPEAEPRSPTSTPAGT